MRVFVVFACLARLLAGQTPAPVPPPPTDIPSGMAAGAAAYLRGDYKASLNFYEQAGLLADQAPPESPARYDILRRLASVHAAAGEYDAAESYILLAVHWREEFIGPDDPKIADDLLQGMAYYRSMHLFNEAHATLTHVMRIHAKASGMDSTAIADDYSRMSLIFLDQKNLSAAAGALESAISTRIRLAGLLDGSLIYDLDRLGTVQVTQRAYEKAEATYRHALVIRETLYGKESAELISTVDGLAYACFGEKKYEDAEPVYQRLLGLWAKSAGEDHPMLAAALDKVAIFYLAQEKFDQAMEATRHANAIRSKSLANGLNQAATEEYSQNNWDAAVAFYQRALKVMDPPDPLYDDLRPKIEALVRALQDPALKLPKKTTATKK